MDAPTLRSALARRLQGRTVASGSIVLPAVPSMIDEYVEMCVRSFRAIGVAFNDDQLNHLREALAGQIAIAFAASPRSEIVITYDSPIGMMVNYHVKAQWSSLEAAYDHWLDSREPPLFGSEPDARVWALATAASDPARFPILDVGAGTGRNTLALARRGHPVDAIEQAPQFAATICQQAEPEALPVRVIQRDVFSISTDLRRDYRLIVLSEVATDFRSTDQLRAVFDLASRCLGPGGHLVLNVFLVRSGCEPDAAARELGQQCYTAIFSRAEINAAAAGSPLELESDESVYDYEKANLPAGAWPPTSWYQDWILGRDVYDLPAEHIPIEMRWLVYRKKDPQGGPRG